MSTLAFTDQRGRIRKILENALPGTTYVSSVRESEASTLLLTGRRADGKRVNVRFRAVRESDASAEPAAGSALRLQKVSDARKFSLWRILIPFPHGHSPSFARVTIEAGDARLDIVCQDAEWWEDEAPPEQA
ncbi:MAG TPA: hypothetical protein VFY10_14845 [Dehalococcoidia bacterium]|nr:hypothetical protein [Dehalococcoidia bacterium]